MDWKVFDTARNLVADKIRTEHQFESTTPTELILLTLVDMLSAELKNLATEYSQHYHETTDWGGYSSKPLPRA